MSTLKVNALRHNSASSDGVTLNSDGTAIMQVDGGMNFRNRIINGAMVIDQRNAGASGTGNDTYVVDRWAYFGSQASKVTWQQNAGSVTPPTNFTNYFGFTSSSAYSVGATELFVLSQKIEGFNFADLAFGTASAKTITLSFWVRSSLTGTFGGYLANASQNRNYPFSYTISAANTWEQKSVTIAGDTTGTWVGGTNGIGMRVGFGLGIGSTNSTTANAWNGTTNAIGVTGATSVVGTNGANFYITGVQLEVGSVATPFERRPYGTELQLCQRYYEVFGGAQLSIFADTWSSGNVPVCVLQHKVTKRADPTVTSYGTFTLGNTSGSPISAPGVNSFSVYINVVTTSARAFWYNNSNSGFTASAEL